jgi:hypothetical protein
VGETPEVNGADEALKANGLTDKILEQPNHLEREMVVMKKHFSANRKNLEIGTHEMRSRRKCLYQRSHISRL